jgi:hypothetical protein
VEDFETIAQGVSALGHKVGELETRALQEISARWDKVYEAMRRKERAE